MRILSTQQYQRIARNVNSMEIQSDPTNYRYWRSVYARINRVTKQLTPSEKGYLATICDPGKAKYFNLI